MSNIAGCDEHSAIIIYNINLNKNYVMSSIAQLVSEIAHSVKQPDSVPVRKGLKLAIIHARNELIRRSYEANHITDKVLQQRFKLSLIDVPDGDLYGSEDIIRTKLKRTRTKVPKPVRLTNNLPFHSVRTAGVKNPIEIAFVKEASSKFYAHLPGMCPIITYDYINEYIYINTINEDTFSQLGSIIIESVFEYPHLIPTETVDEQFNIDNIDDNDEFLLPEDMIGNIKKLVLETWNPTIIRDTNEIPSINKIQ